MICPRCRAENRPGRRFCASCGEALSATACPGCGFANDPGDRFCGGCNRSLTSPARPGPKAARPDFDGERRRLTVMFCDLVGSTPLSLRVDPEDLRELMNAYQSRAEEAVNRYGGYLARIIGDGLLIYFGYPQAHEDEAQRAVRAGLEITAAMPELNEKLRDRFPAIRETPLQVRIGIHTGLAVVGDMGSAGHRDVAAIVGETPNIAARVQSAATPDAVMISAATHELVRGYFVCQSIGRQELKGLSASVELFRVVGPSGAQSRFELVASKGLTPLVGRDAEMALLRERWKQATLGTGQAVLLSGEPGIGKSRLVWELKEELAREGFTQVDLLCSAYHQNTAYHPVLEHLQRLLGPDAVTPRQKLSRIEEMMREFGFSLAEAVPLLAALFSLPLEGYPPLTLAPQRQRERTQQLLVAWLLKATERSPVLIVWEDLHWADPSTVELHDLLLSQIQTRRILILETARPEFVPSPLGRSHALQLQLNRLPHQQIEVMAAKLVGGKALPSEVMSEIVDKTDGVPLFVEELVKMVVESGMLAERSDRYELASPRMPLAIPSTLHDSLMARLDRLSTVREVVQLGALLGREFSHALIGAVWALDDALLETGLTALVDAEILYRSGQGADARYLFKHALIQETSYESMLKSKRQQLHQHAAHVLEEKFPEIVAAQPELLAHHYTVANRPAEAAPYWQRAGESAAKRSANREAVSHLTSGLQLLEALPDTIERAQQELALRLTLGAPLAAIKGYAAPEVEKTFRQARELCRRLGEIPQLFPVLFRLRAYYVVHGELQTARELSEQMLRLATATKDRDLLLEAHYSLGTALIHLGRFDDACDHFGHAMEVYDLEQHRSHTVTFGQDPAVASLIYGAWALAYLGHEDRARKNLAEALALAATIDHPLTSSFCFAIAATVAQVLGDPQFALENADRAIEISRERGFAFWLALAVMFRAWAIGRLGRLDEGIATLGQAISAYGATGAQIGKPHCQGLLAELHGLAGRPEEGLRVLADAIDVVARNGNENQEAPELYRLKAELLLATSSDRRPLAEESLRLALDIAGRQRSKLIERRAQTLLETLR